LSGTLVSAISTPSSLGLEFESDLGHFHYASWHTPSLSDTLVPVIITINQSLYDLSESDFDRFILCYDTSLSGTSVLAILTINHQHQCNQPTFNL
jgi:hypothetical protein